MKQRYQDEERKESDETLTINHLDVRPMLILNENKTNFYDFTIDDFMMVARHTGYKPGVFTHIVANEQIYDRHIDAAMEMKQRYQDEERKESDETLTINHLDVRPMLILNHNKTNFYDFTIDDFTMVNYNPIKPQLKLELGI
jgi:thymidylate synthase